MFLSNLMILKKEGMLAQKPYQDNDQSDRFLQKQLIEKCSQLLSVSLNIWQHDENARPRSGIDLPVIQDNGKQDVKPALQKQVKLLLKEIQRINSSKKQCKHLEFNGFMENAAGALTMLFELLEKVDIKSIPYSSACV